MFDCPVCGERVDPKAKSCPHCGADEETGWKHGAFLDVEEAERAFEPYAATDDDDEDVDASADPDARKGPGCLFIAIVALLVGALIAWLVSSSRSSGLP